MCPLLLRPDPRFLLSVSALNGAPLCSSGVTTLTSERRPGEVGLTLISAMSALLGEVDFLARLQAHVRLFPVAPPAAVGAEALGLALDVGDPHRLDVDLEQELDRRLHLGLGRILHDSENDLRMLVGDLRRLFRYSRREQQRKKAFRPA